ncbi:MAG: type II secretion system protein [Hydrogenophaga sp.]|uniref:type II secretion system protein n=1 Tax=Hydrogenophaga sp. TaxID=1904254 RepID=UPI003D11CE71
MNEAAHSRSAHHARRRTHQLPQRQGGFTLVEMAVVLVIIGVILGAVMIGRDAQRNAEYLRIRQTFVNQWAVAYNSYVQRTGVPPGDNLAAPTLMVNGAVAAAVPGNSPGSLCETAAPPGGAAATTLTMRALFLGMGIELPNGRGLGFEDRYVYLDTNGLPQNLQVCFRWDPSGTLSGAGNLMVISGLTPDLAQSLDAAIDGQVAANRGSFREAIAAPGLTWSVNNTQTAAGAAGSRDQTVATVTAHYKMSH